MTARAARDTQLACSDCGFQTKITTAGLAAFSLAKHSCDRTRLVQARAARVVARKAASGEPRDCQHPIARHQHGTKAAYVLDLCRCRPCRDATSTYERHREREKLYGRWQPYVDAEPARQHVLLLRSYGIGPKVIARLSGVPHGALAKLVYGDRKRGMAPSRRIRPETAAKLLSVQPRVENLAPAGFTNATGTWRRLQALVAIGYSQSQLAGRLGKGKALQFSNDYVQASTARAVRELYEQLAFTQPPEATHREKIAASRARRYAADRRWPPPLWWDDEDLDDPTYAGHHAYRPRATERRDDIDPVAVQAVIDGRKNVRLTIPERREVIRRLHAQGLSDRAIQRRTGITDRTTLRIRQELALPANAQEAS